MTGVIAGVNDLKALYGKYDGNISVIQSHMIRESIIVREAIRRYRMSAKHIFRVHTHISGSDTPSWRRGAYHVLDCITSRYVDKYVPISDAVANELANLSRIGKHKIQVVRNGIPQFGPPDTLEASQDLLPRRIAVIGDLQERKQQHFAVEVIGVLKAEKGIRVELHLVGGVRDNYLHIINEYISRYGVSDQVKVHGYKDTKCINRIIKDIAVVWLPSRFEGIPTSIIEGMSMKKLVIATPVGGTQELVRHGETGFLHEVGNHRESVRLLEHVFTTPGHKFNVIRECGFAMWRDQYAIENMMNGLIAIYKELDVL